MLQRFTYIARTDVVRFNTIIYKLQCRNRRCQSLQQFTKNARTYLVRYYSISLTLQETEVKVLPDPDCSLDLSQFEMETVKLDTTSLSGDSSYRRYRNLDYNILKINVIMSRHQPCLSFNWLLNNQSFNN